MEDIKLKIGSKPFITNFDKLKTQLWFWILLGIMLMYIFFMIAKNLIIIIGGFFLGVYLYNFFNTK